MYLLSEANDNYLARYSSENNIKNVSSSHKFLNVVAYLIIMQSKYNSTISGGWLVWMARRPMACKILRK